MRLMFIVTALNSEVRKQAILEWSGLGTLNEVIAHVLSTNQVCCV